MLNFKEYEDFTITTAIYSAINLAELSYLTLGLTDESGEVAGKVKRILRGDYNEYFTPGEELKLPDEVKEMIAKELGDVCWYLARLATFLGYSYEDIHSMNIKKLTARKEKQTLIGSGDNR